jgi:hypothetical protein
MQFWFVIVMIYLEEKALWKRYGAIYRPEMFGIPVSLEFVLLFSFTSISKVRREHILLVTVARNKGKRDVE